MKNARRMLIYKEKPPLSVAFLVTLTLNNEILQTAPQTAKISLAKQSLTRVQLQRPDFDNGMKTKIPCFANHSAVWLQRPDFDNGMKTKGW